MREKFRFFFICCGLFAERVRGLAPRRNTASGQCPSNLMAALSVLWAVLIMTVHAHECCSFCVPDCESPMLPHAMLAARVLSLSLSLSFSLSLSLSLWAFSRVSRGMKSSQIFLASTPPPCLISAPTGHAGGLWRKPADPVRALRTCFDNQGTCVDIRGPQRQLLFGALEVVTGRVHVGRRAEILESQCICLIIFTNWAGR